MVLLAQSVRALDCDSKGYQFDSDIAPKNTTVAQLAEAYDLESYKCGLESHQ